MNSSIAQAKRFKQVRGESAINLPFGVVGPPIKRAERVGKFLICWGFEFNQKF